MNYKIVTLILLVVQFCRSQTLIFLSPSDFVQTFRDNKIKVVSSPIGYKPKFGTLHGKIVLSSPLSACSQIKQVGNIEDQEDIFVMADDTQCLQSVKAHNIGNSGAYVGLVKRNINNTLHDREINVVHIPILEIQPNDYDRIVNYMKQSPEKDILAIADFNPQITKKKISIELWLSPTKIEAYKYISKFQNFINNQVDKIEFTPNFVLHSQNNRKQYIGCYSSGRFCPPQLQFQGRSEGSKIVGQALRQIIIAKKSISKWFVYASFYAECLQKSNKTLWQEQNAQICSQNSMMSAGIDPQQIFSQFTKSFQGPRQEVDNNIYLEQERQLYIQQKIQQFPVLVINGKQYSLQDQQNIKVRICSIIHPDPTKQTPQCQKITNPSLFSTGQIIIGTGLLIGIIGLAMIGCKKVIYRKMKLQMKGEVDKTLSQYYKYMDTFQEPNPVGKLPLMQQKIDTNQIGSVELQDIRPNK